jgi:5-hydroxyisourate hydrolase
MSPITTHVLDTSRGRPAFQMQVVLQIQDADDNWQDLATGSTDAEGRVRNLLSDGTRLEPGTYRLRFATGRYFAAQNIRAFYPEIDVVFSVGGPGEHYHVPLLLSPFGYSTYRGS